MSSLAQSNKNFQIPIFPSKSVQTNIPERMSKSSSRLQPAPHILPLIQLALTDGADTSYFHTQALVEALFVHILQKFNLKATIW